MLGLGLFFQFSVLRNIVRYGPCGIVFSEGAAPTRSMPWPPSDHPATSKRKSYLEPALSKASSYGVVVTDELHYDGIRFIPGGSHPEWRLGESRLEELKSRVVNAMVLSNSGYGQNGRPAWVSVPSFHKWRFYCWLSFRPEDIEMKEPYDLARCPQDEKVPFSAPSYISYLRGAGSSAKSQERNRDTAFFAQIVADFAKSVDHWGEDPLVGKKSLFILKGGEVQTSRGRGDLYTELLRDQVGAIASAPGASAEGRQLAGMGFFFRNPLLERTLRSLEQEANSKDYVLCNFELERWPGDYDDQQGVQNDLFFGKLHLDGEPSCAGIRTGADFRRYVIT